MIYFGFDKSVRFRLEIISFVSILQENKIRGRNNGSTVEKIQTSSATENSKTNAAQGYIYSVTGLFTILAVTKHANTT